MKNLLFISITTLFCLTQWACEKDPIQEAKDRLVGTWVECITNNRSFIKPFVKI